MDRPDTRRLLIVAGEASGDRHAARLVAALRRHVAVDVRGVAGPALAAEGVTAVAPMDDLAVIGFTGVLARLPRIRRAFDRLRREATEWAPHAALLVDSPGFNFRIGPRLAAAGIPVFYYIAPQVWAWHPERAAQMARWVRRLAVVFPFEERLFREAGVDARFVGHPLLDGLEPEVSVPALRAELGLAPGDRLLGLLPGSRRGEIAQLLGPLLGAAERLRAGRPDLVAVVPLAPGVDREAIERRARAADVRVVAGRTRAVMAAATACAVASGTATLETALLGTPLVVMYRTGALNWEIARRVVTLTRIGLPNIVAGEDVAPELLQGAVTAERIAAAVAPWLDDPRANAGQRARLAVVRERLGAPGAAERAAAWLAEMLA